MAKKQVLWLKTAVSLKIYGNKSCVEKKEVTTRLNQALCFKWQTHWERLRFLFVFALKEKEQTAKGEKGEDDEERERIRERDPTDGRFGEASATQFM